MAFNLEVLEEVRLSSIEPASANEHYHPVATITASLIFPMAWFLAMSSSIWECWAARRQRPQNRGLRGPLTAKASAMAPYNSAGCLYKELSSHVRTAQRQQRNVTCLTGSLQRFQISNEVGAIAGTWDARKWHCRAGH